MKFNVDGAASGKPGLGSIGGVLRICEGEALMMFSKKLEIKILMRMNYWRS